MTIVAGFLALPVLNSIAIIVLAVTLVLLLARWRRRAYQLQIRIVSLENLMEVQAKGIDMNTRRLNARDGDTGELPLVD